MIIRLSVGFTSELRADDFKACVDGLAKLGYSRNIDKDYCFQNLKPNLDCVKKLKDIGFGNNALFTCTRYDVLSGVDLDVRRIIQ